MSCEKPDKLVYAPQVSLYAGRWSRVNRFLAQCYACGIVVTTPRRIVLDYFCDALESKYSLLGWTQKKITEAFLLATCDWLRVSRLHLIRLAHGNAGFFDVPYNTDDYVEHGELYTGPSCICLQRWTF